MSPPRPFATTATGERGKRGQGGGVSRISMRSAKLLRGASAHTPRKRRRRSTLSLHQFQRAATYGGRPSPPLPLPSSNNRDERAGGRERERARGEEVPRISMRSAKLLRGVCADHAPRKRRRRSETYISYLRRETAAPLARLSRVSRAEKGKENRGKKSRVKNLSNRELIIAIEIFRCFRLKSPVLLNTISTLVILYGVKLLKRHQSDFISS